MSYTINQVEHQAFNLEVDMVERMTVSVTRKTPLLLSQLQRKRRKRKRRRKKKKKR